MTEYATEHDEFPFAPSSDQTPLEGVKVIDAGTMVAAPFAATLLADFGADVIKIEHPEYGDGLRNLEPEKNGTPLWWKITGRNKRCITLDYSSEEATEIFNDLVEDADIVIENFRPGTMEQWGIGYEDLREVNPGIIMLRITGFGQNGPYKDRAGFGRIAGAMSGMTNLIGNEDGPPMSPGYPLADGVSGILGAFATMVALYYRDCLGGGGQYIDLSLYETLFRTIEFNAIEYDQLQEVRKRTGNTHPYVAPSSLYKTADGDYISMAASTDSVWRRLCQAINRPELIDDERFKTAKSRVEHSNEINAIVEEWIAERETQEIEEVFDSHEVAYGPVYDIKDIFNDEQYRARNSIVRVKDNELGEAAVQAVTPKFSESPGEITHLGPKKGEHNNEIYKDMLSYSEDEIIDLMEKGII